MGAPSFNSKEGITMTKQPRGDLSRVPLDNLLRAAQRCSDDDTPAMNEIVRRFEGLSKKLARAVRAADHVFDDLANAARVGLVRAVRRHDGRPGFPSFAEVYMRGAAFREYQRWMLPETADIDAVERVQGARQVDDIAEGVVDHMAPWGSGTVATIIASLDPLQRVLVELRYIDDAPIKEIAGVMGTSGPAVSQRIGTIHRTIEQAIAA